MHSAIANHMSIKNFCLAQALVIAVFAVFSATIVQAAPLRVVTSFYPVYVATLNVADGVEGVEISNLTSPHIGCLHDYQLTAGDARKLADADLLLANGAGMEPFLEKVARQSPGLRVVEVSEGIPLMDGNPHVWVSFEGARRQAANIAEVLAAVSPDRAEAFRANARAYAGKLSALEKTMRDALAPYAGTPIVTFHEAFPYFARDFRLEIAGVIESEPGTEPSARELADTIKLVRARGVKALFGEPQFSDRSAQVIARETGTRVYQLDPVVTGPSAPDEARDAYLRAMKSNLAVLQEALR
jgi:zinc transport system substrate-binding protein